MATKQELQKALSTPVTKHIITSKTFWVGLLEIVAGVMILAADLPEDMNRAAWLLFANGIVMIVLRKMTNSGVTVK